MREDEVTYAAITHVAVPVDRLRRLEQVEAVARTLREPYQQGGPSAEFVTLRRLLKDGTP
jgi:hypothetical protein